MRKIWPIIVCFLLMLAGCGDIEWFPDQTVDDDTNGNAPPTVTAFSFPSKTGVTAGSTQTSDPVTLAVSSGTVKVTVSGAGKYSLNSGAYTTSEGSAKNGDVLTLQHVQASGTPQTSTTVTVGDVSATFTSTTASSVTSVNSFTLGTKNNVAPGSIQSSVPVPITMSGTSAPISVANGEYSINSGTFTSASGTINNNSTVTVRHTAASSGDGRAVTTLTIGDKSSTFTTIAYNVNPFTFAARTAVPLESVQVSDPATVTFVSGTAAPISVTEGEYSINNGAFTSAAGVVKNNEVVRVRQTAFNVAGHTKVSELTVGNQKATFSTTTAGAL